MGTVTVNSSSLERFQVNPCPCEPFALCRHRLNTALVSQAPSRAVLTGTLLVGRCIVAKHGDGNEPEEIHDRTRNPKCRKQWVESYVAGDKTFCVYLARDKSAIERHAELSGFPANTITEIVEVIDPATAR